MEALVARIVEKESETLCLTFNITEVKKGRKQVNWRYNGEILDESRFMDSYQHIKEKLRNHSQYDGWDLTCGRTDDGAVKVLNEGSLFFNWKNSKKEGYELILDLVSN
jgi:hypothetical protein